MKDWPHPPVQELTAAGAYMLTAGTCQRINHFNTPERLTFLRDLLFEIADAQGLQLQAWAVMANHYHLVSLAPADPASLRELTRKLHSASAREINRLDKISRRKIWAHSWNSYLDVEMHFLARLKYVHQNPVHHKLVPVANQYEWCSAKWFEQNARPSFVKTVYGLKIERFQVMDHF